MIGSVVSKVVAPPIDTAASGPHQRATSGAANKVKISRMTLHNKAIVASSGPRKSAMKMLDNE